MKPGTHPCLQLLLLQVLSLHVQVPFRSFGNPSFAVRHLRPPCGIRLRCSKHSCHATELKLLPGQQQTDALWCVLQDKQCPRLSDVQAAQMHPMHARRR